MTAIISDDILLQKARGGDQLAFRRLVERHEASVRGIIRGMLGAEGVDDVAQEVFLRFYRSLANFQGNAALGTYLGRIAINTSLNAIAKRKKRRWLPWTKLEEYQIKQMQKIKVITVVASLLLVGFVGGFLTNRYLVEKKVRHFRQLERGQNFGEHFLDRIDATPEQTPELRSVLEEYGTRFRTLGQTHQQERAQLTDSLFHQITPLLTDEQQKQSQRWRRFLERGPEKPKREQGQKSKN